MRNVALMAMAVGGNTTLDGLTDEQLSVTPNFRNPMRPSLAATADAQAKVARVLESLDWSDVASCRDAVIEAVCMVMAEYGAAAAQASADMYDSARSACVGAPMGAVAEAGLSTEATAVAVRAFVNEINDGNRGAFDRKVLERVDWETKRAAANSMRSNGSRDPLRPRFARVPSGGETCRFCIMLASRGPVYKSKDKAGASEHFHPGCDCRIVPFWDAVQVGGSRVASPTTVEGYDPDALYDEYVGFMGDPRFRKSVARSAAKSKGSMSGGKEARPTVHLSTWDRAYKEGRVSFGSIGEVTRYIEGAEDYEDLFERIAFFEREFPEYGIDLGSKSAGIIAAAARDTRSRLLGKEQMAAIAEHKGPAAANGVLVPDAALEDHDSDEPYFERKGRERFSIPEAKLTRYALCMESERGRDKAVAFERALGFTDDDAAEIMRQVYRWVGEHDPEFRESGKHGDSYTTDMVMVGRNGKTARVVVGWMKDQGKDKMRLTTIYVAKRKG